MILTNFKNKKKSYLIVFCILYLLGLLFVSVITPFFRNKSFPPYNSVMIIYFAISLIMIFCFTDLFKNNIHNLKTEKEKAANKFYIKKITVIFIYSAILIGKTILAYKAKSSMNYSVSLKKAITNIIIFIFSGISEESIFSGLLYEILRRKKVPFIINVVLVSLLFSFAHWQFSIIVFLAVFIFRIVILIGYYFYPSLFFFGIFHTLWNSILYIFYIS